MPANTLTPGVGFLLTLVFGFWLSRHGRPYSGVLFNLHKLVALATVFVAGLYAYHAQNTIDFQFPTLVWVVTAAASAVALFASGASMSISERHYAVMKTIHRIAPVLLVAAMTWMLHPLIGNRP
jgi:hypothetical protein